MGMERRTFYGPDIDVTALGRVLLDHYTRDGYQTQIMPSGPNGVAVQARKGGAWQKSFGMSKTLTAVVTMDNEYVAVEVGGAEWADKGVAAGIGAIIFFPALITAGVGAFQQSQLQTQTWQLIEQYIRTNSAFGGSAYSRGTRVACASGPAPPGSQPSSSAYLLSNRQWLAPMSTLANKSAVDAPTRSMTGTLTESPRRP